MIKMITTLSVEDLLKFYIQSNFRSDVVVSVTGRNDPYRYGNDSLGHSLFIEKLQEVCQLEQTDAEIKAYYNISYFENNYILFDFGSFLEDVSNEDLLDRAKSFCNKFDPNLYLIQCWNCGELSSVIN